MTPLDDRYISNKNICEVNETNVVSRQVIQTPLIQYVETEQKQARKKQPWVIS